MFNTRISPPREHVPPGLQVGRFTALIDCGTQQESIKGKTKELPILKISAEFPAHVYKTGELKGRPLVITRKFTNSMSEKANLYHFIAGYRGKDFNTEEEIKAWLQDTFHTLVGRVAKFTVVHKTLAKGDIFSTFDSAAQEAGMVCPPAINKPVLFSMSDIRIWNPSTAERSILPEPYKSIVAKYGTMLEVFKGLHEKAQEYISQSPEFKAINAGRSIDRSAVQADAPLSGDDDVPF